MNTNIEYLKTQKWDYLLTVYPGQLRNQDVLIDIDPEARRVSIETNGEIGNAVPADVWEGRRFQFCLSFVPTIEGAVAILEDQDLLSKIKEFVHAYHTEADREVFAFLKDALSQIIADIVLPDHLCVSWATCDECGMMYAGAGETECPYCEEKNFDQ